MKITILKTTTFFVMILTAFFFSACSGGGGGGSTPCENENDCDNDNISAACDVNDSDSSIIELKPECQLTGNENVDEGNNNDDGDDDSGCVSSVDCDGDGITTSCDANDNDSASTGLNSSCDADGDGHVDMGCSPFDDNDDGTLSSTELSNRILCDNCIGTANADQADADNDFFGDACDTVSCPDGDGDSVCNASDNCPSVYNADQANMDSDSMGNACDDDTDGDGDLNSADNCPLVANADQANRDSDTQGDACDDDEDGDGVLDVTDNCDDIGRPANPTTETTYRRPGTDTARWTGCGYDTDQDGILDHNELPGCLITANATSALTETCRDTDGDGTRDASDPDDDADKLFDVFDNCPKNYDIWLVAYSRPTSSVSERDEQFCEQQEFYDENLSVGLGLGLTLQERISSAGGMLNLTMINTFIDNLGHLIPKVGLPTNNYRTGWAPNDVTNAVVYNALMARLNVTDALTPRGIFVVDANSDGLWDSCNPLSLTTPTANARNVPLGTNIVVTFLQDMNPSTINSTSFIVDGLTDYAYMPVNGTVTYNAANRTATFDPSGNLPVCMSYEVRLRESIRTQDGRQLPDTVPEQRDTTHSLFFDTIQPTCTQER